MLYSMEQQKWCCKETLENFNVIFQISESASNRGISIKAQVLLTHISNFNFIFSIVITRKIFDIINWFELIGSSKDPMSNTRVNIDKYHNECYSQACKLPQKINVNDSVPRTWAGQTTRENLIIVSISLLQIILSNSIESYCLK